jgi:hypothetical protein
LKFAKTKKISLETTIMSTTLAQKREAIEKNKAVKQAFRDKMLAIICEDHGLPACLAPYVRFNKCSISLVAKEQRSAHRNVSRHYRKSAPICLALLKNIMSLLEAKRFLQHQAQRKWFWPLCNNTLRHCVLSPQAIHVACQMICFP